LEDLCDQAGTKPSTTDATTAGARTEKERGTMKAHVDKVLTALTVDELWEGRDRIGGFVKNATYSEVIVYAEEEDEEETEDDRSGWILDADPDTVQYRLDDQFQGVSGRRRVGPPRLVTMAVSRSLTMDFG
jgi:hypothetical protein